MRKLSESMWADAHRKNIGVEIRKEDEQSPFFGKGVKYRFYTEGDKRLFKYHEIPHILEKNPGWRCLTIYDLLKISKREDSVYIDVAKVDGYAVLSSEFGDLNVELTGVEVQNTIKQKGLSAMIWLYNDTYPVVLNEDVLNIRDLYDYAGVSGCSVKAKNQVLLIEDKVNESLWADAHKKNIGIETRKEDEQSPFFGEGIEYRLYKEGDKVHFTYDEALKIEKKEKGWRLPMFNEIEAISTDDGDFISDGIDTIQSTYGSLTLPNMGWINAGGTLMGTSSWLIMVKSSHDGFYTISKNGLVHHRPNYDSLKKYSIVLLHDKVK